MQLINLLYGLQINFDHLNNLQQLGKQLQRMKSDKVASVCPSEITHIMRKWVLCHTWPA